VREQLLLFEINEQSENMSFCSGCGAYIAPDQEQTAYTGPGKPTICCRDCKKDVYRERVFGAISGFFETKRQAGRRK